MTKAAAKTNNFNVIGYFYRLTTDPKMLQILATRGKIQWLTQLQPQYNNQTIIRIIRGALAGGYLELAQSYLALASVPKEVFPIDSLSASVKSGNIAIVTWVWDLLNEIYVTSESEEEGISEIDTEATQALAKAIKYGYDDIINFLLPLSRGDVSEALYEAAKKGDTDMIHRLIDDREEEYIEWGSALQGAAEGGHRQLIDYIINRYHPNLAHGLLGAVDSGNTDVIDYIIDKGADEPFLTLDEAVASNQLEIVRYVLNLYKYSNRQILEVLDTAIKHDNLDIFKLLLEFINDYIEMGYIEMGVLIGETAKFGSSKVQRYILKHYSPAVNTGHINHAKGQLNVLIQLIQYQIEQAKKQLPPLLANKFPNAYI